MIGPGSPSGAVGGRLESGPGTRVTALDQYMEATPWPGGRGVISHDTALAMYELSDVNPSKMSHLSEKIGRRGGVKAPRRP
jgi:hypothetical protein